MDYTWVLIVEPRLGDCDADVLCAVQASMVSGQAVEALVDSLIASGHENACAIVADQVTEVFENFERNYRPFKVEHEAPDAPMHPTELEPYPTDEQYLM